MAQSINCPTLDFSSGPDLGWGDRALHPALCLVYNLQILSLSPAVSLVPARGNTLTIKS